MRTEENPRRVVVTDLRIPFWSMVVFMVKWAIAAIPALVILVAIGMGLMALGEVVRAGWAAYQERETSYVPSVRQADHAAPQVIQGQVHPPGPAQGLTRSQQECVAGGAASGPAYEACIAARNRCMGNPDERACLGDEERLATRKAKVGASKGERAP